MKITHVVENLNRGGLERMVIELVKRQHAEGHHCQVVCLFDAGSLAHELTGLGIPVHACQKRRSLDLPALARARRWIRSHATELLHTHNAVAHYLAVFATTGLTFARVINTRHGMGGAPRAGRREWLYQRALPRTSAVVTVCDAARSDAVARGLVPEAKAVTIPNGIAVASFSTASSGSRRRLLQMLKLAESTRIFGTVGRLNWAKDQRTMIRAFAKVWRQCADTVLVLVGDGELRLELQKVAENEGVAQRVRFLGDRDDVAELLRGFDVFVLSSVSEGYSMALLEACASGLPIIATDVGGNGEIIRDEVTGVLVKPADEDVFADAMLGLLLDPARSAALAGRARSWVEQHGSLEAMAARYARLYAGQVV